jgi:hypothetical protein
MRLRHKPAWFLKHSLIAPVLATTTTFIDNAGGHALDAAYAAHQEKTLGSLESVNTMMSASSKMNRPARTG